MTYGQSKTDHGGKTTKLIYMTRNLKNLQAIRSCMHFVIARKVDSWKKRAGGTRFKHVEGICPDWKPE